MPISGAISSRGEALLQLELDCAQPFLKSPAQNFSRRPPVGPSGGGGGLALLLYRFILLHVDTFLSLKCQPVSCLNLSHDMVASTHHNNAERPDGTGPNNGWMGG